MNFLADYRERIEREIREVVKKGSTPLLELNTLNSYHLGFCDKDGKPMDGQAGKYIRPLFCLGVCAGLGGNPEHALPAAACLELTHRCTLIFDDIQDKGLERNNRPSVWAVWGIEQAINAGLALSSQARLSLQRLSDNGIPAAVVLDIMEVLEMTVLTLCQGQYRDISYSDTVNITFEDYLGMIEGKTAALIGSACEIGAKIAMVGKKREELARDMGISLGMAFQVHDDYLGIWGDEDEVGKTANDLIEKKRSLPVVLALNYIPSITKYYWELTKLDKVQAGRFAQTMEKEGIKQEVIDIKREYLSTATEMLNDLGLQKKWDSLLRDLIGYLDKRTK